MKKLLSGVALGAFLMSPAMAADLSARMPVKAAPAAVAIYNWTGLYVGAQIGGTWGDAEYVIPATGARASYDANGIIGGGHIGYLWQNGTLVLGGEIDFNGSGAKGDDAGAGGVLDRTELRWAGSVRGILGVTASQWLFYGTGGFAFSDIDHCFAGVGGEVCSAETHTGWTAGGGIKYAFSPNWTAGVEYRYTRYQDANHPTGTPALDRQVSLDTNEVTFRLSYRFGGAPLMARY